MVSLSIRRAGGTSIRTKALSSTELERQRDLDVLCSGGWLTL